jgi:hypothetical protein
MRGQERPDLLGLMGREIVDDDMNRSPTRLRVDNRGEKA